MGTAQRKLNLKIWDSVEEYNKCFAILEKMPRKKLRYYPDEIDPAKWASLIAKYNGSKKNRVNRKITITSLFSEKTEESKKTYKPGEIIRRTHIGDGVVVTVRERLTTNH